MNKFFYILFLSTFLYACTSNTISKKPNNLISKNKMVDLLTDMLLASGGENIKNLNLERNVNYFPLVYKKHNIDSAQFTESNYYYTSKIDEYDEILRRVDERLKALKQKYDDKRKLEDSIKHVKKDSLKNIKNNLKKELKEIKNLKRLLE